VTGTGSVLRTATYTLPVATSAGGLAFRGLGSRCIDVAGGNSADTTPVQLWDCNGGTAQQWSVSGTTLRALGKCMDATAAGTANGTKIQLYTCNGSAAQNFTFNATTGEIRNTAANRCVDVTAANPANGTRLQLYDCNGTAAQKWARA
jgi:glucosylceramidase